MAGLLQSYVMDYLQSMKHTSIWEGVQYSPEFLHPRNCSDLQYQDFHKLLLQLVILLGTNAVPKDGSKEAKKKKIQS